MPSASAPPNRRLWTLLVRGRLTRVEPDSLEARVEALETQMGDLSRRVQASEQDAAAARVLAGAADRDVTEFHAELRDFRQATVGSFNALREDMNDLRTEMNTRFARVDNRLARVDDRFDQVDNGFIQMRGKLDAAAAGQQQIVDLLQTLIADQD
jgi:chaperonin cofactor prefoldin